MKYLHVSTEPVANQKKEEKREKKDLRKSHTTYTITGKVMERTCSSGIMDRRIYRIIPAVDGLCRWTSDRQTNKQTKNKSNHKKKKNINKKGKINLTRQWFSSMNKTIDTHSYIDLNKPNKSNVYQLASKIQIHIYDMQIDAGVKWKQSKNFQFIPAFYLE